MPILPVLAKDRNFLSLRGELGLVEVELALGAVLLQQRAKLVVEVVGQALLLG
jgi:hypothetical protein